MEQERAIRIFTTMSRIRAFEERALSLFESNKLRGSVHLCIGQEAIAATVCSQMRDIDYITSSHRGHGHSIAKGADPSKAMAELMGKATGYCKGRGGSMHIADFTKGNLGANAIVGGGMPIAAGAALSAKLRKTDQVAVSFFGDGASNQGIFHESINLASVWKLPVIYICENNGFGISVPVSQSTSVDDISKRAAAYAIPGETVDGNDVLAVDAAFSRALARARAGEGPSLIECKTYRWQGHWIGDPQVYRTQEEVEAWKQKCPIKRFKAWLLEQNMAGEEQLADIADKARTEIEAAVQFAMDSPEPDPAFVLDDVFFVPETTHI
jgi:pyruvate dehydrogenase E1 component alpha subunit